MAWLAKQIKVTTVGESELFRILYAGPEPEKAAAVVNAVTDAYFKLRDQRDGERNRRVIESLDREGKRGDESDAPAENLRELAKRVTGKDPFAGKGETNGAEKHPLAELESRLISAQVECTVLDARITAAEEELAAGKKAEKASGKPPESESLTRQEADFRDAMADKLVEDNAEVQREKAFIAARKSALNTKSSRN